MLRMRWIYGKALYKDDAATLDPTSRGDALEAVLESLSGAVRYLLVMERRDPLRRRGANKALGAQWQRV